MPGSQHTLTLTLNCALIQKYMAGKLARRVRQQAKLLVHLPRPLTHTDCYSRRLEST